MNQLQPTNGKFKDDLSYTPLGYSLSHVYSNEETREVDAC
jgi:hypothetical protein